MGLRGPKPDKQRVVRSDDPIPEEIPNHSTLEDAGEILYLSLAARLNEIGLVRSIHVSNLLTYCEAWEMERAALFEVKENGLTLVNKEKGTRYSNPSVNVLKMAQNEMARQAKILGMEVVQIQNFMAEIDAGESDDFDPDDAASYL